MTGTRGPLNAFLDLDQIPVANAQSGPLAGLRLAVKDIFDVAGYRTGCGNPQKYEEASPAAATAPAVQALLDSGARFVGKTQTDELAFSLMGLNAHFPSPVNPAAPDRITGGSSSGSASAVAGGLADIATGSDTGGSIRAPASFCGLIGLRATHGRISLDGTMPLAPSFDTFGWFAKDMATYDKVGAVLLGDDPQPRELQRPLALDALDGLVLGQQEADEYARHGPACFFGDGHAAHDRTAVAFHRRSLLVLPQAAGIRGLAKPWRLDFAERPDAWGPSSRNASSMARPSTPRRRNMKRNGATPSAANLPSVLAKTACLCCRPFLVPPRSRPLPSTICRRTANAR